MPSFGGLTRADKRSAIATGKKMLGRAKTKGDRSRALRYLNKARGL